MQDNKRECYTADPYYYGILKIFAKENRQHQTAEESLLWENLRGNRIGLPFRRQHIIGKYIADFVCLKKKLIVEVDGGYHSQKEQLLNDFMRTDQLVKWGFKVIRIKNEEINTNLSGVLDYIFDNISRKDY